MAFHFGIHQLKILHLMFANFFENHFGVPVYVYKHSEIGISKL